MNKINNWLIEVKEQTVGDNWDDKVSAEFLNKAPSVLFSAVTSNTQHEAISYWLEICQRLEQFHHYSGNEELAFRYMQFCYCKVQELAIAANQDEAIKRWSIKKLEIMIINMLDFCQQQTTLAWHDKRHQLINDHVLFMQSISHQNLSLGSVIQTPH